MLSACTELLVEKPKNFVSPVNFYQNEKDAEGAIAGVYSSIFPLNGDSKNMDEQHSGYVTGRGSFTSFGNFDKVISSDQYGRIAGLWNGLYTTISRANVVLNRVPQIKTISETVRTRILAEARFLRAMAYFDLLINYGAVPLRTTEITDVSEVAAPRAPINSINDLIINDLIQAEKDLPETVGTGTGKASKWAAKMLLARVYLNKEDWAKAAEKANEVIVSGKYQLVTVAVPDDFYKIFASVTNSEDIMSHHSSVNRQTPFINWLHGAGTPYNRGTVFGFTILPNLNSPVFKNWSENDKRKQFNIYSSYVNAAGVTITLPATNPWLFKKFIKDATGNAIYSLPIYRFTEAFLVYAEASAMAEGKPSTLALERLNIIKRRAYGYPLTASSPVDFPSGLTLNQFRDAIIQERAYEFMLENIRWWDLKRTKLAKQAIEAATGKTFINERLLYPIPQAELDSNPGITQKDQNPGY